MSEKEKSKQIKLNLGCGSKKLHEYVNIDSREDCEPDLVCDIRKLPYEENMVDRILASDILEHVGRNEVQPVLRHWNYILKRNGLLVIKTPNLDTIIDYYKSGKIPFNELVRKLYGQQDNDGNYHCVGFNQNTLYSELMHAGFIKIKIQPVLVGND